jgi:HTH-type transcriptional regulator/antitoxin HigA
MRVIAVSTLQAFWERFPDAEQPLKAWYEEAKSAIWTQPGAIKAQYRSASVLRNRRVVFDIKGNDYRLIVAIAYNFQIVYVTFVDTHEAYDAVDAETIESAGPATEEAMNIRPIHTDADYKATLKEISALMESDPDLGTPEGDRLDILTTLAQAYEARHVPITAPDPVEAIKFRMDQSGLSVKDLEPIIGKSNRVYEVLNRKRPLTLAMIRRLHIGLGIPADVLIAESPAG